MTQKLKMLCESLQSALEAGDIGSIPQSTLRIKQILSLNADFITGVDGGTKPISEVIKDLVTELESIAEELGSLNRLKQVNNILHVIPVVDYMRDIHKQASLVELVKELQKKLLDSLSEDN